MSVRFAKYWLPVVLWMIVIFGASTSLGRPDNTSRFIVPILLWLDPHMPPAAIDHYHHIIRKTAHFVEYAILGLLVWRAFFFDPAIAAYRSWSFFFALLLAASYAASDEFHQIFVPGREPALHDVMLDTCGAASAIFAVWLVRRLRHKE